ncbi:MAG TPA: hypothetical protein VM781_00335, partial [Candidatus Bathyarchaeia archaeon]|nr:hypothetical protein [Candidatus Bathyarchaeia archaeon]
MCDAAGQPADGVHFLGLQELPFEGAPLGDVTTGRKHIRLGAKRKPYRGNRGVTEFPAFGPETELDFADRALALYILKNFCVRRIIRPDA